MEVADECDARILVVDDEPTILEVVKIYLEDAGFPQVVTTTESAQAIALVEQERPDVLLLDLMMPDTSGFDILRALRVRDDMRFLPVVVLTSATDPEAKLEALELGATDLLAKPVDPSELILRLRNTLATKAYQDRLAYSDLVTGVANRKLFLDRVELAFEAGKSADTSTTIIQIGLDRFNKVNDSLGYGMGDRFLRRIAQRLRIRLGAGPVAAPRPGQTDAVVARSGGDEFLLLLQRDMTALSAEALGDQIRNWISEPVKIGSNVIEVTACVGMAIGSKDLESASVLLGQAGQALAYAKRRGPNLTAMYDETIDQWAQGVLHTESSLRHALTRGEFMLLYQPKVDVANRRVAGCEALVRWRHPDRGLVSPAEFIPVAEEMGLIVPLGAWVLREACGQLREWHRLGLRGLNVSVNVSPRQFREPDFFEVVADVVDECSLDPGSLVLELTESTFIEDLDLTLRTLASLKSIGVRISIDDFGTGYSSLSYLRRLKVDEIKIDKSFIDDVPAEREPTAILQAIMAVADGLGLRVVAEGVEHREQLTALLEVGCDQIQGFLFSEPRDSVGFEEFVRHFTRKYEVAA